MSESSHKNVTAERIEQAVEEAFRLAKVGYERSGMGGVLTNRHDDVGKLAVAQMAVKLFEMLGIDEMADLHTSCKQDDTH